MTQLRGDATVNEPRRDSRVPWCRPATASEVGMNGAPFNWNGEHLLPLIGSVAGRALDDIVIVSDAGVQVVLGTGAGTFGAPGPLLAEFGAQQGWRVESHLRCLSDITGDGRADLVGFGNEGIWTA